MSTLVEDLCQEPVNPVITWKEDRILFTWFLLQLNSYWHQLAVAIDIKQANGGCTILPFSSLESIHNLQVTNVKITCLHTEQTVHYFLECQTQ